MLQSSGQLNAFSPHSQTLVPQNGKRIGGEIMTDMSTAACAKGAKPAAKMNKAKTIFNGFDKPLTTSYYAGVTAF